MSHSALNLPASRLSQKSTVRSRSKSLRIALVQLKTNRSGLKPNKNPDLTVCRTIDQNNPSRPQMWESEMQVEIKTSREDDENHQNQ